MDFFLYIGLFFLIGTAPPLRWGMRIAILTLISYLFAVLLIPTLYEPDWGYDLARAGALWLSITVFTGIALRAFFEAGVFGPMRPPGEDRPLLEMFDAALLFAFGAWIGCLVFRAFAMALEGSDGGLAVHAQLAGAATVFALASLVVLRNRWSAPLIGAGLTVAALVWDSGWRYPDIILARANQILPDNPRCLMIGADIHSPMSRDDLMALTIPKDDLTPSAVMLLVQREGSLRLFRWSFRGRAFETLPHDANDPHFCKPSQSVLTVD